MRPLRNIKLTLAYDGTDFAGFQVQPKARTVQGELSAALGRILGEEVKVIGAGRTDAGVHARAQVVNFHTAARIPLERLPAALNSCLPRDVTVWQAEEVPAEFHARYSAKTKVYRYLMEVAPYPSPFLRRFSWHLPFPLDVAAMRAAAEELTGEHDFTSFCAAGGAAKSHVRTLRRLAVAEEGGLIAVEAAADGFLYKMVRNLVGTLVEVGRGVLKPEDMGRILAARDRKAAGPTAPPQGLILWHIDYEENLAKETPGDVALTVPWACVKITL
ncbi:MAG: tRNA pseudouridine38-40 synthase [Bacillota bacterium]|nr:tRNA pseudouridine38-40 synthase [Bacillota bacterium]